MKSNVSKSKTHPVSELHTSKASKKYCNGRSSDLPYPETPSHYFDNNSGSKCLPPDFTQGTQQRVCSGFSPDSLLLPVSKKTDKPITLQK
jgi:hypothetical protein